MNIFLNDSNCRKGLYPFTQTRHASEIRIGILTIKEKWELLLGRPVITISENTEAQEGSIIVDANLIPTADNFNDILDACRYGHKIFESEKIKILFFPWQISQFNDWAIRKDFIIVINNRKSTATSSSNTLINGENIFVEDGAIIEHSIINASTGPVYIGKDAHIMEGNMIRGPFALGEGSVLKMGTKIYGGTTLGPWCMGGGEIKNSVFFGYSNKAHDGYLGDSVIGEWCNLGAGTSNSNVKNSAGDIFFTIDDSVVNAGNKVGLIMGDYSRAAINTSFNTGSMVGICCNIFGREFPPRNTLNFTWGNQRYTIDKALTDIQNWKILKNCSLTEKEITLLNKLYLSNH